MTTNNAVNVTLSGQTGTGAFAGSTSPTIATPVINGFTDASTAAAGVVGQTFKSAFSTVSLTSGVAAQVATIALPAGDWDIWANYATAPAAGTTTSFGLACINTTTATVPNPTTEATSAFFGGGTTVAGAILGGQVGTLSVSISGTTNYFLNTTVVFAISTMQAVGILFARRRR